MIAEEAFAILGLLSPALKYFAEDHDYFISYIMAKFYNSLNRKLFALNGGCDV